MIGKNIVIISIVLVTGTIPALFYAQPKQKKGDLQKLLDTLYGQISGYLIDTSDREMIEKNGGNATYGEITFSGVKTLIKELHLTAADVFYDLGCGVGKMVVQVYLDSPVKKAIGIELSSKRHSDAQRVKDLLLETEVLEAGRVLDFHHADILNVNLSDATVLYLASTCFSDEFMRKLTNKFAKEIPKTIRIITLRPLPDNDTFILVKTYDLPMTWSEHSAAYLYKRK